MRHGGVYITDPSGRVRPDLTDELTAAAVARGAIVLDAEGFVPDFMVQPVEPVETPAAEPEAGEGGSTPPAGGRRGRKAGADAGDAGAGDGTP